MSLWRRLGHTVVSLRIAWEYEQRHVAAELLLEEISHKKEHEHRQIDYPSKLLVHASTVHTPCTKWQNPMTSP